VENPDGLKVLDCLVGTNGTNGHVGFCDLGGRNWLEGWKGLDFSDEPKGLDGTNGLNGHVGLCGLVDRKELEG
jgi:hypothetical protein